MIVVAHDRRPLLMLAAAVVGWALLTAARPLLHAGDGLAAVYFTNSEWNGPPALSVADARPSTATMRARWNGVPSERFSVRWSIAANLKNEGVLFAMCVMAALLVINRGSPAFGLVDFATRIRTDSVFASVLLFSMAPTLMWTICKNAWGLHNDLAVNPSGGFLRLMNRLFDGFSAQYVLHFLILRAGTVWLVIGLVAITLAFSRRQKLRLHRGALIAATTSALYICGLFVVYLSTPHDDLTFYLFTSASRTMMTASVALLISMFFLLSGLEMNEPEPRHCSDPMVQSAR